MNFSLYSRFVKSLGLLMLGALIGNDVSTAKADPKPTHAIAMRGAPKYPENFKFFDYVNPNAPKGGEITVAEVGTFDTLNYLIPKGTPAAGESLGMAAGGTLLWQQLLSRAMDETFSMYGQLAESVVVPDDRSWVQFNINPKARWHDGTPLTVDDVIFSLETLREKGTPNRRMFYGKVQKVERVGKNGVRFYFEKSGDGYDREWPLVLGWLTVISKNYYSQHNFDEATLVPPLGSGPYRISHVDPGHSVTYERVSDFWGRDNPVNLGRYNFDKIRYLYFRNEKAAFEAFKAGEVDIWMVKDPAVWAKEFDFPAVKAGKVVKKEIPHQRPANLLAFVFNTRREIFQDVRVRKALNEVFDFEWVNKTLFYNGYTRTKSYFANTSLGAAGLPTPGELALLRQFEKELPAAVFKEEFTVSQTDGSGNNREQIRRAQNLLAEAGWVLKGQKLVNAKTGKPFEFEILLKSVGDEKIALAYARNLKRLGIEVKIRTVDSAQYQERLNKFDYDMTLFDYSGERSPGNTQRARWHSAMAHQEGGYNYPGVESPVVDALIDKMTSTINQQEYLDSIKALDRVLLNGYYLVPLYHSSKDLIAYWDRFGQPPFDPVVGTLPLVIWWQTKTMAELKAKK